MNNSNNDEYTTNFFGHGHVGYMSTTHKLVAQGERKRRKVTINGLVTISNKLAGTHVLVTDNGDGTFTVTPTK